MRKHYMQHGRHGVTGWQQTVADMASMYAQKTSVSILYFSALCGQTCMFSSHFHHNSKQGLPGSPVQLYE